MMAQDAHSSLIEWFVLISLTITLCKVLLSEIMSLWDYIRNRFR